MNTSLPPDDLGGRIPAAVLDRVRQSLAEVEPTLSLHAVIDRGRVLRRRRRLATGAGGLLAGAATVTLLASTAFSGPVDPSRPRSHPATTLLASGRPVHVDLAAWSVHTNTDSTVTVTIHNAELATDPARLQAVLAEAGVPAVVQVMQPSASNGHQITGCTGPGQDGLPQIVDVLGASYTDGRQETINPAAMPPDSVLRFVLWLDHAHPEQWSIDLAIYHAPAPLCPQPTGPAY